MSSDFWKWGDPQVRFGFEERIGFQNLLSDRLHWALADEPLVGPLGDLDVGHSRLTETQLSALRDIAPDLLSTSDMDRLCHSFGKSYLDLIRIRRRDFSRLTDGVVFPKSEGDIGRILDVCFAEKITVVPFGGGSSVVGGVSPICDQGRPVLTLSTRHLNRLKNFDVKSGLATFEAGVFGPKLEQELAAHGHRLGHYPQSFEFSTLGGWIAARSSGQNSVYFGGIEKLLSSLRVVTPSGVLNLGMPPRHAVGPDLKEFLLGSEGTMGVISEATVRVSPLPEVQDYFLLLSPSFYESAEFVRELIQAGHRPAMVRVSDPLETELFFSMSARIGQSFKNTLHQLASKYLAWRGFPIGEASAIMVGFESSANEVKSAKKRLLKFSSGRGFKFLGSGPGQKWLRDRFSLPYLRDELIDQRILIETFETATTWDNYESLYESVLGIVTRTLKEEHFAFAHLSHAYIEGASLYFTVIGNQRPGAEVEQWLEVKKAICETVVSRGGVISHHHGVGEDHRAFTPWSPLERSMLSGIRKSLDPVSLMNPGKLL